MRFWLVVVGVLLLFSTGDAQETTAGGPLRDQASWSALQGMIEGVSKKADATQILLDKIVECGNEGKLYAPGHANSSAGCLSSVAGADTVIRTDISSGVADNKTSTQSFAIPSDAREIIVTATCRARGREALSTIYLTYMGSTYPNDLLCTVGGVANKQTGVTSLSKTLRLPSHAKAVKITYTSSYSTYRSAMDVRITYMK